MILQNFLQDLNECPPYVLDLEKPQPFHLALSVSVSSKGQRDGYTRMLVKQMWENVSFIAFIFSTKYDAVCREETSFRNNKAFLATKTNLRYVEYF